MAVFYVDDWIFMFEIMNTTEFFGFDARSPWRLSNLCRTASLSPVGEGVVGDRKEDHMAFTSGHFVQ